MPFDIEPYSRFRDTDHITFDGNRTYGLWKRPAVFDTLNDDDIIYYSVNQATSGRPDLIAEEFYGSQHYYWIIVMYNSPKNTVGWPFPNTTIRVPKQNAIVGLLG
jgi:hypothetical protein